MACVDGGGQEVSEKYCKTSHEANPATHEPCDNGPCPFWRVGDWGQCSSSCGSAGVQTRPIDCVWKGSIVDVGYCKDQTRPEEFRECRLAECAEWEVGPWERCSATCGEGVQLRKVICHYPSVQQKSDECDQTAKPAEERMVKIKKFFANFLKNSIQFQCRREPCPPEVTTTTVTPIIYTEPPRSHARLRWTVGPWSKVNYI